jgi:heat shock protein HslJ
MNLRLIINLILVIVVLTASGYAQSALTGNEWSVTYLKGANIGTVEAFIHVDVAGKSFTGNTGCNIMRGSVNIGRGRIRFRAVTTTKRACTRQTAPVEGAMLAALNSATSYKLADERLRLYSGRTLVAGFGPRSVNIDEDGPLNVSDGLKLEDKKWVLESISGAAIPKVEQEAFLIFDPEKGSAGGDTSCNAYGGSYKTDGNKIAITEIISTMRACVEDQRMNIERGFLDGLRAANRYEIKADKLLLYRHDKLLLTFEGRKK